MRNDLISRKALIGDMRSRKYIDKALCEIFETVVDDSPTAYDVDAVIQELELVKRKLRDCDVSEIECFTRDCTDCALEKAIEIVRNGGNQK